MRSQQPSHRQHEADMHIQQEVSISAVKRGDRQKYDKPIYMVYVSRNLFFFMLIKCIYNVDRVPFTYV